MDDLLLLCTTKRDKEQALEDLPYGFLSKDLRRVSYQQGYHITRNWKARTVTFDHRRFAKTVTGSVDDRKTSVILVSPGMASLSQAGGPQSDAAVLEMRIIPLAGKQWKL